MHVFVSPQLIRMWAVFSESKIKVFNLIHNSQFEKILFFSPYLFHRNTCMKPTALTKCFVCIN